MALRRRGRLLHLDLAGTLPRKIRGEAKRQIKIGDITIDAVFEREGPWRQPQDFLPARLRGFQAPSAGYGAASGKMFITGYRFQRRIFSTHVGHLILWFQILLCCRQVALLQFQNEAASCGLSFNQISASRASRTTTRSSGADDMPPVR
jgi:hypothetical protein